MYLHPRAHFIKVYINRQGLRWLVSYRVHAILLIGRRVCRLGEVIRSYPLSLAFLRHTLARCPYGSIGTSTPLVYYHNGSMLSRLDWDWYGLVGAEYPSDRDFRSCLSTCATVLWVVPSARSRRVPVVSAWRLHCRSPMQKPNPYLGCMRGLRTHRNIDFAASCHTLQIRVGRKAYRSRSYCMHSRRQSCELQR